jgi:hypothetical protein
MRQIYQLPDDLQQKIAIWSEQLARLQAAQKEAIADKIAINNDMIALQVRAFRGEEVGSEMSACHKRELENRMGSLAMMKQKERLLEAISG